MHAPYAQCRYTVFKTSIFYSCNKTSRKTVALCKLPLTIKKKSMRLFLTFLLVFSISSVATAQENSTDFRKLVDPRIELMGVGLNSTTYRLPACE